MRRFWIADWGLGIGRGEMREVPGGSAASTFHLKPAPKRRSAFTLIELMGVMAIIGILAAVTLPSMISRIEDANSVGEDAKLEEIARALVAGIKATGMIPNPNLTKLSHRGRRQRPAAPLYLLPSSHHASQIFYFSPCYSVALGRSRNPSCPSR